MIRSSPLNAFVLAAAVVAFTACGRLPDTRGRASSQALRDTSGTVLASRVKPFLVAHPRQSGFHPLVTGEDAFSARIGLARMAAKGLDLQYYIWHNDASGRALAAEMLRAADRGVRVRVLIDDLGTSASDDTLLAIDSHPNIEVRLFNPIATRSLRHVGMVMDFRRVNRRMHNKTFIADNRMAIVGGRNIGDEYFGGHEEVNFADFDVAAVGPVVDEISVSFDRYWNDPASIGITALTGRHPSAEQAARLHKVLLDPGPSSAGDAFIARLRGRDFSYYPGHASALYDDPAKITAAADDTTTHLLPQLRTILGSTRKELIIVSPYFIPRKNGVEELAALRRRGVRVVVLTNSLASTDVTAVHAGYKRYREDLLRAGVELYENEPGGAWSGGHGKRKGMLGSSRASLHAKTFAFDRRDLFVGSLNLDPRSSRLNTEIGVLIECPRLASAFSESVLRDLKKNAYRVELERGRLVWTGVDNDGRTVRFTHEPETTAWERFKVDLMGLLPLEGQL